jgi:hypothetical protein
MSAFVIAIEAETPEEFSAKVQGLAAQLRGPEVLNEPQVPPPAAPQSAPIVGKKNKRKVDAEKELADSLPGESIPESAEVEVSPEVDPFEDGPAPAVEEVAAKRALTIEDAKAALAGVNKKHGMDGVKKVVALFGVDRVSKIPEDKFAEFIAACDKA